MVRIALSIRYEAQTKNFKGGSAMNHESIIKAADESFARYGLSQLQAVYQAAFCDGVQWYAAQQQNTSNDTVSSNYYEKQLANILPLVDPKVKFENGGRSTNWLNVNKESLSAIINLLQLINEKQIVE